MYKIVHSSQYKRDYRLAVRQGKNISLLEKVINLLAGAGVLPEEYHDHPLKGKYKGFRECHVTPDWLLIYKIDKGILVLLLSRTGTHSDLFDE